MGEEDDFEEEVEKTPEPDDGLDPVTRAKNRVAEVVSKINNIPPPENYKPEPEEQIRPESELKEKPVLVGGYFARVVTEEELKRYESRSGSTSRRRKRRSRSRKRSASRKRGSRSRSRRR